jgi:GYF domain 2
MSDRSWFFAAGGQQQGPYRDAQLRDFVARGTVKADTLIWTEGMAGWQKAGEIPGLFSGAAARPPMPRTGDASSPTAGAPAGGGSLAIDAGLWPLLGWSLLFVFGVALVIPAPWAATYFYRWMAAQLRVPGRPNLTFTGQVGDIWYVFVLLGLCSYAGTTGHTSIQLLLIPFEGFLSWMTLRWIAGNLASNGQRLPITFEGSALTYVGWYVLMFISMISIIGWAWVIPAWMRWICRNVRGTRRDVVFSATGLDLLWRTLAFGLACAFLIPIPWALRWYAQWYASQFELVERLT